MRMRPETKSLVGTPKKPLSGNNFYLCPTGTPRNQLRLGSAPVRRFQFWRFQNTRQEYPHLLDIEPTPDWRNFLPVYAALNASGGSYIIVGGQACNIWATYFLAASPELDSYKPFTSRDLDIYVASPETVRSTASQLGVKAKIAGIESSADVVLGAIHLPNEKFPLVQFLKWSRGVETGQLEKMAVRIEIDGTFLSVMHPILTLQGKVHCVTELDQKHRQDSKHAKMAVCYSACFLEMLIHSNRIRTALSGFEHLFEIACSKFGIKAWGEYDIRPENAIPMESIENSSNEQIINFREKRLPQLRQYLAENRTC